MQLTDDIAKKVESMSRYRLRLLLKRNGYGPVRIARMLEIPSGHSAVTQWFTNRCVSSRIDTAVRAIAVGLLSIEDSQRK